MRWFLVLVGLVVLAATGYGQAPTAQSSNITFSEVLCNRVTVSWTSGNGAGRIIIAREAESVDTFPTSGYYIGNSAFGSGAEIKTDQFVVYNGVGTSVVVTNLKQNTVYYFKVFEYNGSGSTFSYNTTSAPEDSVETEWLSVDFTMNEPHQCDNVNYFEFYPTITQSLNQSVSYSWNFGDGATSSDSSPNHVYSSYGKYLVSLTATTQGCVSTVINPDTVAPIPLVSFVLHPDTPNNQSVQCFFNQDGSKNRFFFSNTTLNPFILGFTTDEASITWDWGDGTKSAQYNGRKTYSKPGIYRVVLTVRITKHDIKQLYCVDSVATMVQVKPRPLIADSIFFRDTVMCENGNLFRFENNSGVPGSPTWNFGDGIEAYTNLAIHSYLKLNKTVKYLVKLSFIDTAGCYDEYSDSVRVIRQPANWFNGLDSPYCQYDPVAILSPNIANGFFFGDNVTSDGRFTPDVIGLNTISYRINQNKCVDTFTMTTEVLPRPKFSLGADTTICEGDVYELSVIKGPNAALWSTNGTDSFILVSNADLYWLELNNGDCSYRDSIDISLIKAPDISLGRDTTLCGDGARTVNVVTDEAIYVWSDGYPDPIRNIDQTGHYEVLVLNKCGRDSAQVDLVILPFPCDIYVPDAFSPNSDELNDVFRATGNVEVTGMIIYNRWGEELYRDNSSKPSWDGYYQGKLVQQGTYFFLITYQLPSGEYTLPKTVAGPLTVVY